MGLSWTGNRRKALWFLNTTYMLGGKGLPFLKSSPSVTLKSGMIYSVMEWGVPTY